MRFEVEGGWGKLITSEEKRFDDVRGKLVITSIILSCNMSAIIKVPRNTCSTMHGWKNSENMVCWIDRVYNIIKSNQINKFNSGKKW